jgi:hypothetical protein
MLPERNQCHPQDTEAKIYFDALCVLETVASLSSISKERNHLMALGKISRFCKESGLQAYVIKFMVSPPNAFINLYSSIHGFDFQEKPQSLGEQREILVKDSKPSKSPYMIFLTKQKLIPTTGYYCKVNNLSARLFGSTQVLLGNSVKRILAKSDSKFVEKFALLLEIGAVYICKRNTKDLVSAQEDCTSTHGQRKLCKQKHYDIYYKFTSPSTGTLELSMHSDSSLPSEVRCKLPLPQTAGAASFKLGSNTSQVWTETALSLPNLLISLPTDPATVQTYVLQKIAEGNQEEGICPVGTVSTSPSALATTSNVGTAAVNGLGIVRWLPLEQASKIVLKPCKEIGFSASEQSTDAFSKKAGPHLDQGKENVCPNINLQIPRKDLDFPSLNHIPTNPVLRRYSENDRPLDPPKRNSLVLVSKAFFANTSKQQVKNTHNEVQGNGESNSLDASEERSVSNSPDAGRKEQGGLLSEVVLQTVGLLYSHEKITQGPQKTATRRQRVDAMMEKWRLGAFRNRRYTLF